MSFENPTTFEKIGLRIEWGLYGPLVALYLKGLGLQGGETLLEVGCGGGAVTHRLAQLLPNGRIVGVDPSAYWVEYARRRLRRLRNVELHVGDVLTADIAPGTFDAALFHYVLHDIAAADRPSTLARIEELLKPDGRLFVREPLKEKHGMKPDEIRALAVSVGLREEQARVERAFPLGKHFQGIFRKA
jgi:ubiquinone/menaquinone biosynthesis C-methylase UbiE